jgi:hypothetical protein
MEVPLRYVYALPGNVEMIPEPGAAISTDTSPKFENGERAPETSAEATERTTSVRKVAG